MIVNGIPAGSYFGSDTVAGIEALVMEDFDRAAPQGTGRVKAGGNYAADLLPLQVAKTHGCATSLYLDAKEKRYIEEFSVSNFVGITKDGRYVTPQTESILPSNTNKMLMALARDDGFEVEERAVDFDDEIGTFSEIAACGTAVVLAPVSGITRGNMRHEFGEFNVLKGLYKRLRGVQTGEHEDKHGWMREVDVQHKVQAPQVQAVALPLRVTASSAKKQLSGMRQQQGANGARHAAASSTGSTRSCSSSSTPTPTPLSKE